ncbi:probable protein phosphatase 2C 71 isoform X3 [Juglans microcarpa x Juglans regia]|uniref:probable protein phosphatase 2C 71 isoform X3 n=1 Tax=Juglans microcarpa x Juglans regia TaxID=2249226 RepID=UPI001B7EAE7B|nr:probable protein phosphatase 2C 71 isoform X3 [Juglans microcarpa x Juglans regia]
MNAQIMNYPTSCFPFPYPDVPFRIRTKSPLVARITTLSLALSLSLSLSLALTKPSTPRKASCLATSEPIEPGIEEMLSLKMAHLLFFSHSPTSRSLGFSRFFHFSSKPFLSNEISTPIREPKRRPTQHPILSKHISPSGSLSDDFVILETTECSDGSVLFRFGNASEVEKIHEKKTINDSGHNLCKQTEVDDLVDQISECREDGDVLDTNISVVENVSDPMSELRKGVFEGTVSKLASSASDFTSEVSDSYGSERSSMENAHIGVTCSSMDDKDLSIDKMTNDVNGGKSDEGDVTEVMEVSAPLAAESILKEKTADESVDVDKIESSIVLDESAPSSEWKEEFNACDTHGSNVSGFTNFEAVNLPSIESIPTGEEISTAGFFLYSGAASLPSPSKALTGGGDAYFVAVQNWLGVADGVGQWSLAGVNTGLYARELMENCEKILSDPKSAPVIKPQELLIRSAAESQSPGSSTVLVAYFDGQCYKIDLDDGDVIVTATDGLFDNLYELEIASAISESLRTSLEPQDIAVYLATRAQEVGQSTRARTPFADAAQATGYVGCTGGKLDDVTVIVSLVQRRSSSDSHRLRLFLDLWILHTSRHIVVTKEPTRLEQL